jgi:hypothetical protein
MQWNLVPFLIGVGKPVWWSLQKHWSHMLCWLHHSNIGAYYAVSIGTLSSNVSNMHCHAAARFLEKWEAELIWNASWVLSASWCMHKKCLPLSTRSARTILQSTDWSWPCLLTQNFFLLLPWRMTVPFHGLPLSPAQKNGPSFICCKYLIGRFLHQLFSQFCVRLRGSKEPILCTSSITKDLKWCD